MRAFKLWLAALAALGALALAAAGVALYFYFSPERLVARALDYERGLAGLVRKEADLPGGLHYVYLEGGAGEPLMLLHGFGESSKPAKADYSSRAQAERLHALARKLGAAQLHLGGNSMGGQIALVYAALYPKDVKSLWLLAPAGVWSAPQSETRRRIVDTGQNPMIVKNEEEFAQLVGFITAVPLKIPRRFLDVLAQERIRNYDLEQRIFKQLGEDSVEQRIRGLDTPALIVWGAQDRVLHPGGAGILQQLLTRSDAILMQGVGHLPMLEQPEQCAFDYLKFRSAL